MFLGTIPEYAYDDVCCRLVLGEVLVCHNTDRVSDGRLREALERVDGKLNLLRVPDVHFTIVPESMFMEIRRGIASSILQRIREPDGDSEEDEGETFTAMEITRECLDFLSEHIEPLELEALASRVEAQMDNLLKGDAGAYLEKSEGVYRLTNKGSAAARSTRSRDAAVRSIEAWMNHKNIDEW